jgi:hypothetical protein
MPLAVKVDVKGLLWPPKEPNKELSQRSTVISESGDLLQTPHNGWKSEGLEKKPLVRQVEPSMGVLTRQEPWSVVDRAVPLYIVLTFVQPN